MINIVNIQQHINIRAKSDENRVSIYYPQIQTQVGGEKNPKFPAEISIQTSNIKN